MRKQRFTPGILLGILAMAGAFFIPSNTYAKVTPYLETDTCDGGETSTYWVEDESGNKIRYFDSSIAAAQCTYHDLLETNGDYFYFLDCGAIRCYDYEKGELQWVNYDFQGVIAMNCYTVGPDDTLFLAGYMGPDLFAVDASGKTLINCNLSDTDNYWPYKISLDESGNILITYESNEKTVSLVPKSYIGNTELGSNTARTMKVVKCKEWISIRDYANVNAPSHGFIPLGAEVVCIGKPYNGFYRVVYYVNQNQAWHGYALAEYLSNSSTVSSTSSSASSSGKVMHVANCKQWITLRESDSVYANEIVKIPLGAEVTFISKANNGFSKVEYDGKTGYVLSDFLK